MHTSRPIRANAPGVQRAQLDTGDTQRVAIRHGAEVLVRVCHSPQHIVGGVQQHRGVQRLTQLGRDRHMVVVAVRADHGHHVAAADRHHDGPGVVGGVEDNDLGVVADDPDIVVDFPTAAVEFEGAMGDDSLDCTPSQHHHRAQDLTGVHSMECRLDLVQPDAFGDELLQR